ncbi:MAG: glycosyl hydrolase, partial [Catenulispora sp.]|nr:glycosyl hydrolase [Catenulispora sp.]
GLRAAAAQHGAPAVVPAWQSLGPANGGRVTDIVDDPAHSGVVYAAAASGGVWKSTDGGASFRYSWDPGQVQAIGALAVTATGVLYAGTGEANPGGGSSSFPGNGVYKSTDGGATWQNLGLAGTDRIGRITVDPANPDRLFVAATGSLFTSGGARGLYETTDGGATWKLVLAGSDATTGAVDVAISPGAPNTVVAAMWDAYRTPSGRTYGGTGSGVFKSTDGGTTWARVGGGLPASSSNLGRMGIAYAPDNASRMYAIASDTTGNFLGFWTSADGGATWAQPSTSSTLSGSQSTYGWWFGRIWVDPTASQHIWVAGVTMLESSNGGSSWNSGSSFHADQHALAFDPFVAGRVLIGNDGGVYRSTANGSVTGSWTHATGLSNMQFYTVGVSQQDPTRINGGLQDNGSVRSWSSWGSYYGGDGLQNLIDPTNQAKVYACSQYGSCGRSTNSGNTVRNFGSTTSARRAWLTPLALDPTTPSVVYYGGDQLNRSANSAQSFSSISPDLSHGDGGTSGVYGTISTIAVAKTDGRVIYAGTDDGRAWITRNTGATWTEITAGLPNRWITRIVVDPTNADTAYISLSGYRSGDSGAHVLKTTNGGTTWQDVSGNLPNAPVNVIALDPRNTSVWYVGTDVGVFSTSDGGASWTPVGSALPLVSVADLQTAVSGASLVLTAGTYGLGVYQITLP